MRRYERRLQVYSRASLRREARLNNVDLSQRLSSGYAAPQADDSGVIEIAHKPRPLLLAEYKRTKDLEPHICRAGIREPERRRNNASHLVILAIEEDRLAGQRP